jgi:hypothetical protein
MAKGKHAAALFEVIHSNKRLEPASASLNTPKWWFKGRPATPAPEVVVEPAEPRYSAPAPEPIHRSSPSLTTIHGDASRGGRGPAVQGVHVDAQRQQLNLKMRRSTAIVSGFALLVAVGIAYVMGRHVAGGPQSASAQQQDDVQTEVIRKQRPLPGALDVQQRRATKTSVATGTIANNVVPPRTRVQQQPPATANILSPDTSEPAVDAAPPQRSFGLNYVLVQSWPADRAHTAQQACDYLKKYGILCTVEPAPAGFHRGWVAVISTRGFDKISSAECQAYVAKIEKVGERFGKSIDHFQPQLFKLK